jgi:hypothetical protein
MRLNCTFLFLIDYPQTTDSSQKTLLMHSPEEVEFVISHRVAQHSMELKACLVSHVHESPELLHSFKGAC